MSDVAPPRKDYHIFQIKYPRHLGLRDRVDAQGLLRGGHGLDDLVRSLLGDADHQEGRGTVAALQTSKPLKIISDLDTRTILVQGATPSQLATIRDLIEIYDQPTTAIRRRCG